MHPVYDSQSSQAVREVSERERERGEMENGFMPLQEERATSLRRMLFMLATETRRRRD